MAQNGVPFGEGNFVRDWLQIKGNVYKPSREHPKRIIDGLKCTRSEVSGSRFWALFKSICKTPENFFKDCFVHNVCPLMFMKTSSKNVTPPQLKAEERKQLTAVCNNSFCKAIKLLNVKLIIGVGKFAADTAANALKNTNSSFECSKLYPQLALAPHLHGYQPIASLSFAMSFLLFLFSAIFT
ncbi:SMUG1 [Acanthosepion pharaonis]|uniref:SMUG1 n=1 Tax=Acanthosepion pharaonis TaxID=158019 RepID=A0A812C9Z2_ACAPH|nr:SMUG1 [Sepia pharaonis]